MNGEKLAWYLNRLRTMDWREVGFRASRTVQNRFEQLRANRTRKAAPIILSKPGILWLEKPQGSDLDVQPFVCTADALMRGEHRLLWESANLTFPPEWHTNPLTHQPLPRTFGKLIDYRQTEKYGDIKYCWVLNRNHQLVSLAQAYCLTDDERYAKAIQTMLGSWLQENPAPLGINWTSALESAIRLINWSAAWSLLGGLNATLFQSFAGQALRDAWLASIHDHCRFIRAHLSRYSSANNHLIGELAGLFIASQVWPFWPGQEKYGAFAQAELEAEVLAQIYPDGVSREQTSFYEHFVAEFLVYAGWVGQLSQTPFSAQYWQRVEGMLTHLAAITPAGGAAPAIGDGDDALVLHLDPSQHLQPIPAMLALGGKILSNPKLSRAAEPKVDTARWLKSLPHDDVVEKKTELESAHSGDALPRVFPDGGYYVLGERLGFEDEVRIQFDTGPLGYKSIAAHGHADALSILLWLGGRPVLIDPGTYAYQSAPAWRDYFRGTRAHNCLVVDGKDQADIGGKFMWVSAFDGRCEEYSFNSDVDSVTGVHDGYLRLPDPVAHRRTISYDKKYHILDINDVLTCNGGHETVRYWHFAPELAVEMIAGGVRLELSDKIIEMRCPYAEISLVRGEEDPISGWDSPRFGIKRPTYTASCRTIIERGCELRTQFQILDR